MLSLNLSPKRTIFLIPVLFITIIVVAFLVLTAIDLTHPTSSWRLWLLLKLNLPHNEKIISLLKPTDKEAVNITFKDMYWFYKNQNNYNPLDGYWCAIDGKLKNKDSYQWLVQIDNGQVFTLDVFNNVSYRLKYRYLGKDLKWYVLDNIVVDKSYFNEGDSVTVRWTCPITNPNSMYNDDKSVIQKYLTISPDFIYREKRPDDQ